MCAVLHNIDKIRFVGLPIDADHADALRVVDLQLVRSESDAVQLLEPKDTGDPSVDLASIDLGDVLDLPVPPDLVLRTPRLEFWTCMFVLRQPVPRVCNNSCCTALSVPCCGPTARSTSDLDPSNSTWLRVGSPPLAIRSACLVTSACDKSSRNEASPGDPSLLAHATRGSVIIRSRLRVASPLGVACREPNRLRGCLFDCCHGVRSCRLPLYDREPCAWTA